MSFWGTPVHRPCFPPRGREDALCHPLLGAFARQLPICTGPGPTRATAVLAKVTLHPECPDFPHGRQLGLSRWGTRLGRSEVQDRGSVAESLHVGRLGRGRESGLLGTAEPFPAQAWSPAPGGGEPGRSMWRFSMATTKSSIGRFTSKTTWLLWFLKWETGQLVFRNVRDLTAFLNRQMLWEAE